MKTFIELEGVIPVSLVQEFGQNFGCFLAFGFEFTLKTGLDDQIESSVVGAPQEAHFVISDTGFDDSESLRASNPFNNLLLLAISKLQDHELESIQKVQFVSSTSVHCFIVDIADQIQYYLADLLLEFALSPEQ